MVGPSDAADIHEAEYRQRLQRALGPGYELRDLIGRGGFGAVYSAWDRTLERDVAVKALRHDLFPTRLVLERFQREAKAVARLRHPHILPVYTVGEGEGLAFMVMPLIRGESLQALLQRGDSLSLDDVVRIVGEVCRALDAAHRAGFVHRDVKPENILLDGDDRHALLADFGIAKAVEGDTGMTASGMAIGSPQYMSPEQAMAEPDVDARSDVYSLGAVAYELLSKRRPYEAANFQQLLVRQATQEPTALADVAPDVPPAIAGVVMRALSRERGARWQTAGEFAAALAGVLPRATAHHGATGDSWFARRGLVAWLVYVFGIYFALTITALQLTARAAGNRGMMDALAVIQAPFVFVLRLVILFLILELGWVVLRSRRAGATWSEVRLAAFGQPRWWQTWYPRSLRAPDNVWDDMPATIRIVRSVVWLSLAVIPVALPLIFVVPKLQIMAAGVAVTLPLPLRMIIAASEAVRTPAWVAWASIVVLTAHAMWRHRVSLGDLLPLLFTSRREAWNTPAGRRLLESPRVVLRRNKDDSATTQRFG